MSRTMNWTLISTLPLLLLGLTQNSAADPLQIGSEDRSSVALTLYNQNIGLVREERRLPPLRKNQQVTLEDVSAKLQIQSLRISNAGPILEQNLNTNLLNQQSLLQHYVGKQLRLARLNPVTGQEVLSQVKLINIEGNRALINREGRFESIPLNNQWRFIFPSLPEKLLIKPSLTFRSEGTARAQDANISYLSGGMNWSMNYVLTLNKAGNRVDLDGLASLSNQTGTDFHQAKINLLAGELYQPQNRSQYRKQGVEMMRAMSADAAPAPKQEGLQDFHLYNLPRKTDLLHGQVKQVSLITATNIPVERLYDYQFLVYPSIERNQHRVKPELLVKLTNDKKSQLGMPLPAGELRTFSPDSQNQLHFIGGSNINHTGKNDELEVRLGKAFDVSIHRKQTHFSKTFNGHLVSQELRISNSRNTPAKINMTANFPLAWTMKQSSHPHQKIQGGSARWQIEVPANGDSVLSFSVQMDKR